MTSLPSKGLLVAGFVLAAATQAQATNCNTLYGRFNFNGRGASAFAMSDGLPPHVLHAPGTACAIGRGLSVAAAKENAMYQCALGAAHFHTPNHCKIVGVHQ